VPISLKEKLALIFGSTTNGVDASKKFLLEWTGLLVKSQENA
jgi:hypothetical protein